MRAPEERVGLAEYLYLSGVVFFTLGFGDVTPLNTAGRLLAVIETGVGFGFLAMTISYLPVVYQAFSRREITITLLDARAGSPPTAGQLLVRIGRSRDFASIDRFLQEWEHWSAEVLESHISFPMLAFFRSQHDNQSWLAAITAVLDTSALLLVGVNGTAPHQAQLTFAMARHTVVDLAQNFKTPPQELDSPRLSDERRLRLWTELRALGFNVREDEAAVSKLTELRGMYEPFVNALGQFFVLNLPPIVTDQAVVDNWQTSAWMRRTSGIGTLAAADTVDDHDD